MTVITDENDIVVEVCLIPGTGSFPKGWHVYFPVIGEWPTIGSKFTADMVGW
jgi:hypothetical protein